MKFFNPDDRFIIYRTSTPFGGRNLTVSAEDVVVFIEEIQERFTKSITDQVELARVKYEENSDKIVENEATNQTEHEFIEEQIEKNTESVQENSDRNDEQDNILQTLELNERDLGFYGYAFDQFVDPQPVDPELPITIREGFLLGLDENGEPVYDRFRNIKKLLFNKTESDVFIPMDEDEPIKRKFTNLFASDTIELVFVNEEFDDIVGEARVTFRVKFDQEKTADEQIDSDYFEVDVELVNGRGDAQPTRDDEDNLLNTGIPVYYKKPTKTRYIRCGVYPAQYIDESVHTDQLAKLLEPIGSLLYWPSNNNIPDGYLVCDGSTFASLKSSTKYLNEDFSVIERLVDKVPDFRGRASCGMLQDEGLSKSRNRINSGTNNQLLYLKGSLFELDKDNTLHFHKVDVNKAGSHTHKLADTSKGSKGNQTQAHKMNLSNNTSGETDKISGHTHAANMSDVGNHTHKVYLNVDDTSKVIVKDDGEVRPAGWGMTVLIKYKHILLD